MEGAGNETVLNLDYPDEAGLNNVMHSNGSGRNKLNGLLCTAQNELHQAIPPDEESYVPVNDIRDGARTLIAAWQASNCKPQVPQDSASKPVQMTESVLFMPASTEEIQEPPRRFPKSPRK
jgi:hypothetical protein